MPPPGRFNNLGDFGRSPGLYLLLTPPGRVLGCPARPPGRGDKKGRFFNMQITVNGYQIELDDSGVATVLAHLWLIDQLLGRFPGSEADQIAALLYHIDCPDLKSSQITQVSRQRLP